MMSKNKKSKTEEKAIFFYGIIMGGRVQFFVTEAEEVIIESPTQDIVVGTENFPTPMFEFIDPRWHISIKPIGDPFVELLDVIK